jgi:hypothetical protein
MFVEDFNPSEALAACRCPRCRAVGLVEVDSAIYEAAPAHDVHAARYTITPSVPAGCPACGLLMDWPGCCEEEAEAPPRP